MKIKVSNVNTPNWKEVTVKSRIPAELEKLSEISRNIWWAWNFEATELFRDLDPELWKECGQNPVLLLERMSYEKLEALAKDKVILRRMNDVYTKFRDYLDVKPDENRSLFQHGIWFKQRPENIFRWFGCIGWRLPERSF